MGRQDLRVKGLGLGARFALSMTLALTLVMASAGYWIYTSANNLVSQAREQALVEGLSMSANAGEYTQEKMGWVVSSSPRIEAVQVTFASGKRAVRYEHDVGGRTHYWFVPEEDATVGSQLATVIGIIVFLVVLVGAGVSLWVAGQVVGPLRRVIDDLRQIARGDLGHRTRAQGGGEIELLARSIDRMSGDLAAAREAELELSMRERELELAAGVREALMPFATPDVPGYDLRAAHLPSGELLGDFHHFVSLDDGRVGVLCCDVSGTGVPAALVGATARAYLAAELERGVELALAFRRVNARLHEDVRRGMYVTALYALIDPALGSAQVVCAGHKVPLLHYVASEHKLRKVHPGGIALGFDKGPVFDRSLEVLDIDLAVGDRLVLSSQGPLQVVDASGDELGEAAWYQAVGRGAKSPTAAFLRSLKQLVTDFADEEPFPKDISILTVLREE
ncbi:MAG: SpoIIE family protein phosphatase [Planctomycetota bacterium]|nr:SpoIIE family protein phosphatase [Planctomycetota bacterium]